MHNLLRCRRGSAAFVTVIALVPLIGVVAVGGEAGSWYVTKQHAQNAADSAECPVPIRSRFRKPPFLRFLTHKRTIIAVGNLRPRTRSATRAIPPIPAPHVLRFRQVRHRSCRSIGVTLLPTLGPARRLALPFVPLLASNSQRTWQQCLVCPLSTYPLKPSPGSIIPKSYVFWDLEPHPRARVHLHSVAVAA